MKRGAKQHKSSDGVPNRKGGSWPNHPAMRYELPIPFSPGAENVTDAYREGWERTFGRKTPNDCSCGGTVNTDCGHAFGCPKFRTLEESIAAWNAAQPTCEVCGDRGQHRLERGVFACEIES